MENEDSVFTEEEIIEDTSKYTKIFNEVLDEVGKERNNYSYDIALEVPKMLKIILNKKCGRNALKEMILYSQEDNYEFEWPRAKAYKLAKYLNVQSLNPVYYGDSLKQEEFVDVLNIFEVYKKSDKKQKQFVKEMQDNRNK